MAFGHRKKFWSQQFHDDRLIHHRISGLTLDWYNATELQDSMKMQLFDTFDE